MNEVEHTTTEQRSITSEYSHKRWSLYGLLKPH